MTIVVIEDEKWLADLYKDVLDRAGYDVVVAQGAQEGLDALDDHVAAAVVLDLMLPGVNGIGFLHELRSYSDLADIPIIINSAVHPAQCGLSEEDWRAYGVVAYVSKTAAKPQELVRAVRGAVHEAV